MERIKYLQGLVPKDLNAKKKYFAQFTQEAVYLGNGVYTWDGIYSNDTAELFTMGVLRREGVPFKTV